MAKVIDSSMSGELKIEVKATLTVDENTFKTCVNLIEIYAREHGVKGIILDFRESPNGPWRKFLMDNKAVDDVLRVNTKYNK